VTPVFHRIQQCLKTRFKCKKKVPTYINYFILFFIFWGENVSEKPGWHKENHNRKPFFIISGNHISPAIIRFSSFNPMYKTATKLQKVYHVIVFCCCLPGNQSCRTTTKTKQNLFWLVG